MRFRLLVVAVLTIGYAGCAPTLGAPRGAYPPLRFTRPAPLTPGACSWAPWRSMAIVTAAHCVGELNAIFLGYLENGMPDPDAGALQLQPVCVDRTVDSAILRRVSEDNSPGSVLMGNARPAPVAVRAQLGERVCYDSWQGRRNCGSVIEVGEGFIRAKFDAAAEFGESGSLVRGARGSIGVLIERDSKNGHGANIAPFPTRCS